MRWIAVVLSVVMFPAVGQTVQKCVDGKGHVTLTSGACPQGQREAASYDATPERVTPEQLRRQAEMERWQAAQQQRRVAQGATVYHAPRAQGQSRHQRCEAAKRWRDAEIERVGLKRTHAMLRSWDDYVYQQCK